jgi:hypothetical protein
MADTKNTLVTNGGDLAGLLVNARQDAIFAGYESSLYMPGSLINVYDVPAGSVTAQIPKFAAVAASDVSTEAYNETTNSIEQLGLINVANSGVNVTAKSYGARALLKDLGGMDATNVGTVLGRAVSERFDSDVSALYKDSSIAEVGSTGVALTTDVIAEAVQAVRANKFAGQVNLVLHPKQIEHILKDLSAADFAGGDFQTAALREGFVGRLFGANIFQSALIAKDNSDADYAGCAFVDGAFGIAMFKNLDIETDRNVAGMGTDIVASAHMAAALVDANRAVRIISDV